MSVSQKNETPAKDLATLLAELDAKVKMMTPGPWQVSRRGDSIVRPERHPQEYLQVYPPEDATGIVALVNAYPALREGIAQLQQKADERDAAIRDYQIEGDQTVSDVISRVLREVLKRGRERDALRALVAQQREALLKVLSLVEGWRAYGRIPEACGACGTPNATCDNDCVAAAYDVQDLAKARAVLAQEVPRE